MSADNPRFFNEGETAETRARRLNTYFSEGGSVWKGDILQDMRSFPNPIMVDLEQTLIDFSYPGAKGVNPMASEFLHRAKRAGTVFIVTRIGLLIDDGYENIHDNPGILGIQVEDWIMSESYRQVFGEDWKKMDDMSVYPTILEAMDLVEEHYSKETK